MIGFSQKSHRRHAKTIRKTLSSNKDKVVSQIYGKDTIYQVITINKDSSRFHNFTHVKPK